MKVDNSLHQNPLGIPAGESSATPQVRLHRSRSEGILQGLAEPGSGRLPQANEPTSHRRRASFPGELPDPNVPAPALHELIARNRVAELDARFGSLQPPLNLATDGIKDWEREWGEYTGKPLMHRKRLIVPDAAGNVPDLTNASVSNLFDIDALKSGDKKYMWSVSALGRLFIGELEPAGTDLETGNQRYRGHPLLVGGGPARVSGELRYDDETGKFIVLNQSGRYSRYEDRNEASLTEVAGMFA